MNQEFARYQDPDVPLPPGAILLAGGAATQRARLVALLPGGAVLLCCALVGIPAFLGMIITFNPVLFIPVLVSVLAGGLALLPILRVLRAQRALRAGRWREGVLLLPDALVAAGISIPRARIREIRVQTRGAGRNRTHHVLVVWDSGTWELPSDIDGSAAENERSLNQWKLSANPK